jgi:hypothetical protein
MFMFGRQNAGRNRNTKLAEFNVKCRKHPTFGTVRVTSSARNTGITSSPVIVVCDNHREFFFNAGLRITEPAGATGCLAALYLWAG